ncbi:hypothetical protein SAURM35S_01744 [Streptomyces aurantiogriseus]
MIRGGLAGRRERAVRLARAPAEPGRHGRVGQSAGPGGGVGRQLCRAGQGVGGVRVAAPGAGPVGRGGQGCGDLLVGADGRGGQVPCPAVRVAGRPEDRGQRLVGGAPVRRARGGVHRRADQRVPESDRGGPGRHQPGGLGRLQGVLRGPEPGGGGQHHPGVAAPVERGGQQHPAGTGGQCGEPATVDGGDSLAQRQRVGQRLVTRQLAGRQQFGDLPQGERVAAGGLGDQGRDPRRGLHGRPGGEGPGRVGDVQPGQPPLRQVAQRVPGVGGVAGGDQQPHAVGVQTARGEQQGVGGGPVDPVEIVDDAQQPVRPPGLGQQRQHPRGHQEPVLYGGRRGQPQRPAHGVPLRTG